MDCSNSYFDVAILKVSGRCNIDCKYCYMFNLSDQRWKNQPKLMSRQVLRNFFLRTEQYLRTSKLSAFTIIVHGGEPLLAGHDFFLELGRLKKRMVDATGVELTLVMQTNSLLLDDQWLDILREAGISFGISIDGPAIYHDKHRVSFSGHGTHKQVENKIRWLNELPDACKLFRGVLCVLQPEMDGREIVRYFYDLGVKTCDFLLPDQNYSYPSDLYAQPGLIPTYGVVLEEAYREWRRIDDPNFSIRLFDVLVRALLGTPPAMDCLGTTPVGIFTIASSGEIEPLDTFKCCGEEYTKTGRTVFDTDLMDLPLIPNLRTSLERAADLPADCLSCTYKDMCGGGYMPHRFKDGSFKNPSVYCADLKHICSVVSADIKAELGDIAAVLSSN